VIVPVFAVTLSNPSVSQMISFAEALVCITNLAYFDHVAQYQYRTKATIQYMEKYLEEFCCLTDVFS
jgi:hypothetical protein